MNRGKEKKETLIKMEGKKCSHPKIKPPHCTGNENEAI
jgi:hypothetical protein